MKNRKAQTSALLVGGVAFVLSFLLLTIGASIGGDILTNIREDEGQSNCQTAGGYWNTTSQSCEISAVNSNPLSGGGNPSSYNISTKGLTGLTKYANQFGTVGLIAGAALIISVLVGGFAAVRGGF